MTSAAFKEFTEISVTEPLRQGDVLEAVNPDASRWARHLLVITADCDFAHDKHRGRVTCVPLMDADHYLMELQVPRIRDQIERKALTAITNCLHGPDKPNLTPTRLLEWATEEEPEAIVEILGLDKKSSGPFARGLTAIRTAHSPASSLEQAIELMVRAKTEGPDPQTPERAFNDVMGTLRAPYRQPPGDALFVSSIGPGHQNGYFAYLRHLEQIWEPHIAIGPTHSHIDYRRISRLKDRFIHALVQRFALVFMAIGLPHEYEELRDMHAEMLGDSDT